MPPPSTTPSIEPFLRKVVACNLGVERKHTLTQLHIANHLVGYLLPEYDTE